MRQDTKGDWRVDRHAKTPTLREYDTARKVVSMTGRWVCDVIGDEDAELVASAPRMARLLVEAFEGWPIECECKDARVTGCWKCEARRVLEGVGAK